MHPMAFLQKRGHLSAVARGRQMFRDVERMTPARFDILYVIHEQVLDVSLGVRSNMIAQARLTRMLGLKRQTVWKMVERLIELGLVKKIKDLCGPDPRRNYLSLTEEGIQRVREAYGAAFTERLPLPRAAPTEGEVPRHWRRPELADVTRSASGEAVLPQKVGREVARAYTSFTWKRVGRGPKRFYRSLAFLDATMSLAEDIARALGDRTINIYPVREPERWGLPPTPEEREARRLARKMPRGWCRADLQLHGLTRVRPAPTIDVPQLQCEPRPQRRSRKRCRRGSDRSCPIATALAVEQCQRADGRDR